MIFIKYISKGKTLTNTVIQNKFNFRGRNRNLPWFPRKGKRTDLAELFMELGYRKGVEIGTRQGVFAKVLCDSNPKLHLTCVDPWTAYYRISQEDQDKRYLEALEMLKGLNVTIIKKPSMEAVGTFKDRSLDFVYVDGDHDFDCAMMDIIYWMPKVRTEGIFAVHDYNPAAGADVVSAVNAYTRCHHIDPWYVTREMEPTAYWVVK